MNKQQRAEAARLARIALGLEPGTHEPEPAGVAAGEGGPTRARSPLHEVALRAETKSGLPVVPHVQQDIDPKHFPKKHPPGSLKRGDSVWYQSERYYVEYAPSAWTAGCFIRICNERVYPGQDRELPSDHPTPNTLSFCVHADLVELAPTAKNPYLKQPTLADVARKERAAKGETDVGDPVAMKLRSAVTLDDVYKIGAAYLGVPVAELKDRYGKLNAGQQRMNVGNRMRAKWRKEQRGK